MRSGREQEIDHLYRRAGFGASQEEVEGYTSLSFASYAASVARLIDYSDIPDDVDSLIGRPGYVGVTGRSGNGFQPATQHPRRPAALAVPDGAHQAPAAGEDGALLAQPLRHRLLEDQRRYRRRRFRDAHARGQARRGCQPDEGSDRALSRARAREFSRPVDRGREGSGDARVARRPDQRSRPAAGELRPRADGALHAGRRPLRGDRRLRRRARVHGVEPEPGQPQHRAGALRVLLQLGAARHRREGVLVPGLCRRPAHHPRALRRRGHAGRHRLHQRRREASRHRAEAGAKALRVLRQRSGSARRGAHRCARAFLLREELRDRADGADAAALAAVQGSVELLQAVLLAGRVRRPVAEGSRLERVLGEQRAQPADQHGAAALRAARRQRLGARAGLVLERRHAGADELRRGACHQSALQPARSVARQGRLSGEPAVVHARSADAAGVRVRRARGAARLRAAGRVDRVGHAARGEVIRPGASHHGIGRLSVRSRFRVQGSGFKFKDQ